MLPESELRSSTLQRLHRLGGVSLLRQMIDIFLVEAPIRIHTAQQAVQTNDLVKLEQAVHSLKSSAGNLGVTVVQELAGQLEQLATRREVESMAHVLKELQAAFLRAKQLLEEEKERIQG